MEAKRKESIRSHDDVLEEMAGALDISPSKFEEAESRYRSLGQWLDRSDSILSEYEPEISPQGSFLLGTVTRPSSGADEYDVDLVCLLNATKKDFTQKQLKDAVGEEVKGYVKASGIKSPLEEGRRCWTVQYADGAQFHMDILPAIPDMGRYRLMLKEGGHWSLAANQELTAHAIAITDKTSDTYSVTCEDWPQSNPQGYAAWFRERMLNQLRERKRLLSESKLVTASVDDIPDFKVKTPLQRSVQLLKRHRDMMFVDDPEYKPISIIITTLAGHAYNEEATISEALHSILLTMDRYIEEKNGESWIKNPVNPHENFADKWVEEPAKRECFFKWLERARADFAAYLKSPFQSAPDVFKAGLGYRLVDEALDKASDSDQNEANQGVNGRKERAATAINQVRQRGAQSRPWSKG